MLSRFMYDNIPFKRVNIDSEVIGQVELVFKIHKSPTTTKFIINSKLVSGKVSWTYWTSNVPSTSLCSDAYDTGIAGGRIISVS